MATEIRRNQKYTLSVKIHRNPYLVETMAQKRATDKPEEYPNVIRDSVKVGPGGDLAFDAIEDGRVQLHGIANGHWKSYRLTEEPGDDQS